jgi:acyl-CoA synthetase (AMP-forming)/AMP-acid ligase II
VHVTGDLGHFDAEGRLVVVGRSDDMVISGGENVMPLAVGEVIEQNPAVHRCAVFGVPDPEWGQVVAAAVTGEALDEQRLRAWAEVRLSPAEVPRVWLIKDDLPELDTGKVDTDGLRAELAG